jgi:hypothetical protein
VRRLVLLLPLVTACGDCGKTASAPDAGSEAAARPAPPSRTPAQIRAEGNHLLGASSAYLAQHARNPVDWYPWGDEALRLAKALDRPIFLSIGYASCHWCHVMEEEVFEKDDVAELLNARFVSIKVDREERPDLDAVYMEAVVGMTGSGGWPMSTFLSPDALQPFFGGTYFPHDKFLQVARTVSDEFARDRAALETRGHEVAKRVAERTRDPADTAPLRARELELLARHAAASADPEWGGWGSRTKFPNPTKLQFLLRAYRKWGDADVGKALRRTLEAMASGGVYDHVGGGFHRYAVDAKWIVPHFEKMLYVNAVLAPVYLEAAAAFDEPRFSEVGRDVLDFMVRDMTTPEGALAASIDADSGGKEGSYYVFTREEIIALAGKDGDALATMLGATAAGTFEGSNVLTRRAERFDAALFAKHRAALLAARNARPRPSRDAKVITAWNGLAIGALARGYALTGDARYRAAAEAAAAHLVGKHLAGDALARASTAGKTAEAGTLDDYAGLARGLFELFLATGTLAHFDVASRLAAAAQARFAAPGGGFHTAAQATPLGRPVELADHEEPAGNAALLDAVARMAALSGLAPLDRTADAHAAALGADARAQGLAAAAWLDATLLRAGPFYEIVVAGDDAAAAPLMASLRKIAPSWSVIVRTPGAPGADLIARLPALEGKTAKPGTARAYVCQRGACKLPTSDPKELATQVRAGWSR